MNYRIRILGLCTVAGAIVCALLQKHLMRHCVDAAGLIVPGSPTLWLLALVTAAVFAAQAALCAGWKTTADLPKRHIGAGVLLMASAVLLAAQLLRGGFAAQGTLDRIISLLQLGTILVLIFDGERLLTGRRGSPAADCVPPLWLALQLIGNYRVWSSDPIVLDYCFALLFAICAMLALQQMAACRIGKTRRGTACFWAFAAVFCALLTLTESMLTAALLPALLAIMWLLLTPPETL